MPHARYNWDIVVDLYDEVLSLLTLTFRSRQIDIVGGDFNTGIDDGVRRDLLIDFVNYFGLVIANSSRNRWDDDEWTFKRWSGT